MRLPDWVQVWPTKECGMQRWILEQSRICFVFCDWIMLFDTGTHANNTGEERYVRLTAARFVMVPSKLMKMRIVSAL